MSVRVAWHDNKWNGKICKDPRKNIHCRGNYSLLSPRLQRRINLDLEEKYKSENIEKIIKNEDYVPPCFWSVNLLGEANCEVKDPHPFGDISTYESRFRRVPSLKDRLDDYSGFTWYFRLGFSRFENENYVTKSELASNVEDYLNNVKEGQSIVFLYANYSNPITGNEYKYALIGAGVLKEKNFPKKYKIPADVMESVSAPPHMRNFPETAWQFKIGLDPESLVVMPYHEYLDYIYSFPVDERDDKWKSLNEIAIPIKNKTIIPHFKFVSRHITHDKAIFLLYEMKNRIAKLRNQPVITDEKIIEMESRINSLLSKAWKNRGRYPGFKNITYQFLKHQFGSKTENIIDDLIKEIKADCENLDEFFKENVKLSTQNKIIQKANKLAKDNIEKIEFFSQFDFSKKQFANVLKLVNDIGFQTAKQNPYSILEKYFFDETDKVTVRDSDYGLDLFQFDIALIPDFEYVDWITDYDAQCPERSRVLIKKILTDTAFDDGSSFMTRTEILEQIEKYPLYYINEKFQIDTDRLRTYEQTPLFKDIFLIKKEIGKNEVSYQLKSLRKIEEIIENFCQNMYKKVYTLSREDISQIKDIIASEKSLHKERLIEKERSELYQGVLQNGFYALTGKAGSGKTSGIVKVIAKFLSDQKYPIYVFTPTGKANLVIRNRLAELGIRAGSHVKISTIHRFLYTSLLETKYTRFYGKIFELIDQISKILDGKIELIHKFKAAAQNWQFNPKVVIIDESSMVDELLLSLLFCMINPNALEYLILVGDEKQLPPIGVGKPLVDIIFNLKKKGLENKTIRLQSGLRFPIDSSIAKFSDQFGRDEPPFPPEIAKTLKVKDEFFELKYFNEHDIKEKLKQILCEIDIVDDSQNLFGMFADIIEKGGEFNLNKVQIITPRRVGRFGSEDLNFSYILDGNYRAKAGTKLICEQNMYHNVYVNRQKKRVLGLANGSIGYITKEKMIYFEDFEDLDAEYGADNVRSLVNKVSKEIYSASKIERKINLGYSITIHKSQGSDFDYVILIIPEKSAFITKELLYTAFTRAKKKLYLFVHEGLKDDLEFTLSELCENSTLEQRKTMLFGYKISIFKPYSYTKKNGAQIEVRSKIELLIAKALDNLGVHYIYEPKDFYHEYRFLPDFKIRINGKEYYIEHLGDMTHTPYRERWYRKLEKYNQLNLTDVLITTTESKNKGDLDLSIKEIMNQLKSGNLQNTKRSYSEHHFEI